MRICLFTPNFFPAMGGVEVWCDLLTRGLIARGHETVVLAQKSHGGLPMPALPYPVEFFRRPPRQHLWTEILAWPLLRCHSRHHFELVATVYGYPLGYAASCVKRRLGVKVVAIAHGDDLYARFQAQRKFRIHRLTRLGYQNADHIVAVSPTLAARARALIGDVPTPLSIIENGIDLDAWKQSLNHARSAAPAIAAQFSLAPGSFTLQVAAMRPEKRHDLAIRAVAQARHLYERLNLKHVLLGDGKRADDLRRLAAGLNIQDRIVFAGIQTGADKAWFFAHARLLMNTSDDEGLPIVLIEAAASALPILASDIQPHRDFIAGSGCGALFKKGDAGDLSLALEKMLSADLRAAAAASVRRADAFDLRAMLNAYESLFRAVIAGSPGSPC